jgi:hypothetical protein
MMQCDIFGIYTNWSLIFKEIRDQTKDHRIGICCFSAQYAALSNKSKDWLAWNQDNVSEPSWP